MWPSGRPLAVTVARSPHPSATGNASWPPVGVRDILSVRAIRMEVSKSYMSTSRGVLLQLQRMWNNLVWVYQMETGTGVCALLLLQSLDTVIKTKEGGLPSFFTVRQWLTGIIITNQKGMGDLHWGCFLSKFVSGGRGAFHHFSHQLEPWSYTLMLGGPRSGGTIKNSPTYGERMSYCIPSSTPLQRYR